MNKVFSQFILIIALVLAVFSVYTLVSSISNNTHEIRSKNKVLYPVKYYIELKEYDVDTVWIYRLK